VFEIGFSELLLIAVLGLVVLGPERLPKVAAQIGRWMGRARSMARQFREQLEEEVSADVTTTRRKPSVPPASTAARAAAGAAATGAAAASGAAANTETATAGDASAAGDVPPDDDLRHNDYSGAQYQPPDSASPLTPGANAELTSSTPAAADDYVNDHLETASADEPGPDAPKDEQRRP